MTHATQHGPSGHMPTHTLLNRATRQAVPDGYPNSDLYVKGSRECAACPLLRQPPCARRQPCCTCPHRHECSHAQPCPALGHGSPAEAYA